MAQPISLAISGQTCTRWEISRCGVVCPRIQESASSPIAGRVRRDHICGMKRQSIVKLAVYFDRESVRKHTIHVIHRTGKSAKRILGVTSETNQCGCRVVPMADLAQAQSIEVV